jgi:hypothetical protein
MAKDKKAKPQPGVNKGGVKSSRRSSQTIENKRRRTEVRDARLVKAAVRRTHGATVVDPLTGKTKRSVAARDRRELQSARVNQKLTPKEKIEHCENGRRQFSSV